MNRRKPLRDADGGALSVQNTRRPRPPVLRRARHCSLRREERVTSSTSSRYTRFLQRFVRAFILRRLSDTIAELPMPLKLLNHGFDIS